MSKYIDADQIRAEIERRKKEIKGLYNLQFVAGERKAYDLILSFLDTLPEQPVEGLEEEIDKEWEKCNPIDEGMGMETAWIHIEQFDLIARHFAEWGAEHLKK